MRHKKYCSDVLVCVEQRLHLQSVIVPHGLLFVFGRGLVEISDAVTHPSLCCPFQSSHHHSFPLGMLPMLLDWHDGDGDAILGLSGL